MINKGDIVQIKHDAIVSVTGFGRRTKMTVSAGEVGECDGVIGRMVFVKLGRRKSPAAARHGRPDPVAAVWESNIEVLNPLDRFLRGVESEVQTRYKRARKG